MTSFFRRSLVGIFLMLVFFTYSLQLHAQSVDAQALFMQGQELIAQEKYAEAIAVFDTLDQRFGNNPQPEIRNMIISSMLWKSALLKSTGDIRATIAVYDRIEKRYGKDKTIEIQEKVLEALGDKVYLQIEALDDPAGSLKTIERILKNYCVEPLSQDIRFSCVHTQQNSIEPLLAVGKTAQAIKTIKSVRAAELETFAETDDAVLSFLLWLADPGQITPQTLFDAIISLEETPEAGNWTFNMTRNHVIARLSEPRKTQATCFADYFEKYQDSDLLERCLTR
ncbi:MAG: hypothetical protein LBQ81_13255 [Zoogloeaceae bacterium]|nr:hypothetical protein [Zoogloeaceae bacterium]